jgi:hypothetical protein
MAQFIRQSTANISRNVSVLQKQRALKKLPAVQTGTEHEMPVQQCAGFAKECEEIFGHRIELDRINRIHGINRISAQGLLPIL